MGIEKRVRTYLDDVPEDVKEQLSKAWAERKKETYSAAEKHGIKIEEGSSFNRVVTFELERGLYHIISDIASTSDISPEFSDVGDLATGLITKIAERERALGCVPLFASNVCDWGSAYAKEVGANIRLRDSIINNCIKEHVVLTGGETANLGDQVRKKGMSLQFTLLSRYDGHTSLRHPLGFMDSNLSDTFAHIADKEQFQIHYINGMPLIRVNRASRFLLTADGTGSKSIVCYQVGKPGSDINCTMAMAGDDGPREGAFPAFGSIGIHARESSIRHQVVGYMVDAGKKNLLPLLGCAFHESDDVETYIMNGVILSEVREEISQVGKSIESGLHLVLLYEEQRSNGITTQRRIFSETFGNEWYKVRVSDAFDYLNGKSGGKYSGLKIKFSDEKRSLGELVAHPSTPYFRMDSIMPQELIDTINFRINVSSGGLFGKTRRLLEPFGIGANYSDVFDAPKLVLLLQMASQVETSRGVVPDEVAYYTWGCGNGAVIGTTDPKSVMNYYNSNGIRAKIGGITTKKSEINVMSKCLDSVLRDEPYMITHKYSEKPLG
jgi:hypothetical protein